MVSLSESLADDVKPFGIKVTVLAPGYFRTKFLSSGSLVFGNNKSDDYEAIREATDHVVNEVDGKQGGDPEKAALAIIRTAEETNPPVHLLLGPDAYKMVSDKLAALQKEFDA